MFDAEAIGAWRGLEHALQMPEAHASKIWLCIDSTSVIWGLRGDAPISSQWAFLECHTHMESRDIGIRWAPGHCGIEGNEAADRLADTGALSEAEPTGRENQPTASGIGTEARAIRAIARAEWWEKNSGKLSSWYRQWKLRYEIRPPPELSMPRKILQHHTALRTSHGDFAWYHKRFQHDDANLECSCGRPKSPEHMTRCARTHRKFSRWPERPDLPPQSRAEGLAYLGKLLDNPKSFADFLALTGYFAKICTR